MACRLDCKAFCWPCRSWLKTSGRAVTALGLAHLRDAGLPRVTLYVDGHNAAALATYERLGFTREHLDVQFTRCG